MMSSINFVLLFCLAGFVVNAQQRNLTRYSHQYEKFVPWLLWLQCMGQVPSGVIRVLAECSAALVTKKVAVTSCQCTKDNEEGRRIPEKSFAFSDSIDSLNPMSSTKNFVLRFVENRFCTVHYDGPSSGDSSAVVFRKDVGGMAKPISLATVGVWDHFKSHIEASLCNLVGWNSQLESHVVRQQYSVRLLEDQECSQYITGRTLLGNVFRFIGCGRPEQKNETVPFTGFLGAAYYCQGLSKDFLVGTHSGISYNGTEREKDTLLYSPVTNIRDTVAFDKEIISKRSFAPSQRFHFSIVMASIPFLKH